jgi:PhoPQ-activated pathogenicity-related protein
MNPVIRKRQGCRTRSGRLIGLASLIGLLCAVGVSAPPAWAQTTILDEYVYADDPNYGYFLHSEETYTGYTIYRLRMTSGQWRDPSEVDRPLWEHWLNLYVPDEIIQDTGLLIINGGSHGDDPADPEIDEIAGPIAAGSGSVLADLRQVPYQPLIFADETEPRSEDALIAYSWAKFLDDTTDVTWPAQLPMARAAVRALDTVQEFVTIVQPGATVEQFVIGGASKRGWATWLTAAAEHGPLGGQRVSAIIPVVIDVLDTEASFMHHYEVYGFWAPAIQDYVDAGVMDYMGTPEIAELFGIVDPYVYRERYTMPKFLYNSAGDQFFLPDSWQFYYDDLPEPKRLRYYPNTDHTLEQLPVAFLMEALGLYVLLLAGEPVPEYSWSIPEEGTIRLQTDEPGVTVRLWQATNPDARDFRYEVIGPAYSDTILEDQGGGVYIAHVDPPSEGWTACLVEVDFPGYLEFSSGVHVVPDLLPSAVRRADAPVALLLPPQAAPNPFCSTTRITYVIPRGGQGADGARGALGVYDSAGRLITTLANPMLSAGTHSVSWNGEDAAGRALPSGVYFVGTGPRAPARVVIVR